MTTYWAPLPFSKYKGKTLPQVAFADPDWLYHMVLATDAFDKSSEAMRNQAKRVAELGSRIRIPKHCGDNLAVEYVFHPTLHKLSAVQLVPKDRAMHEGASGTIRSPYFNLAMPYQTAYYDKTGGAIVVKAIKQYVFKNPSVKLTADRCEKFFATKANFAVD